MKKNLNITLEIKRKRMPLLLFAFLMISFASCVNVKPYQKIYQNDEDMKLAPRQLESFETSIESYREGSSGANGGKTGGGCGCN